MGGRIVSLGIALAMALSVSAQDEAQQWGQACADYNKYNNSRDPAERAKSAEGIGGATTPKYDKQAAAMLIGLLNQEFGRDRNGGNEEKVSGLVLDAVEQALKRVKAKEGVDQIAANAKQKAGNPRVRFIMCRALGPQKDHVKTLIELVDDPEIRVTIGALDGLGIGKDPQAIDVFLKILNSVFDPKVKGSRDFPWEAKWSALTGLAAIGDKSDKVVDGLIDALGRCTADQGRIKVEVMRLLGDYIGSTDPKSDDPNWWRAAKKDKSAPVKEGQTTIEPTEFFGLKAKSSRIVFVLDRTGSMSDPCTFPERPKDPPKQAPTETNGGEKPNPVDEAARAKAAEIKKKYDDRKVVTKMDGLKREFINTIFNLDKRVFFTVVWYEANQQWWKDQLVPATWQNKLDCIQDIDKLQPSGGTNVFGGLEAAFKLVEQPNRPDVVQVDKKGNYATVINGPDTFFLMTDGNHNTGKFVNDQVNPPTPKVDDFIAELKKVNALRKIIVNVVALGDLNKGGDPLTQNSLSFLKKIADETGGSFAHIGK